MKLAHQIIRRQLRHRIRAQRRSRHLLHLRNRPNRRTNKHKLSLSPLRHLLHQTFCSLKKQQNRISINHHVILEMFELHRRGRAVIRGDGGVGDDYVEIIYIVHGLEFFEGVGGVGFGCAVEFEDDEGGVCGFGEG